MAGLTKEHVRIINYVEAQGVTTLRTTKGILFRMPNGETEMLHYTASDWRATRNFRANLRRNGIEYPGDYAKSKHKKPPYKESIQKVQEALNDCDPNNVTTPELHKRLGNMTTGTISHVMQHLGYWHEYKAPKSTKSLVWHAPVDPKEIVTPLEDIEFDLYDDSLEALESVAENKEVFNADLEKVVPIEATPAKEGWTVDLDNLDGTVTIDQLRMLYMATGLNVEIRVWKA